MNKADTMIVLTTGKQDRGTRATLAFSWGCAALAMGQNVSVYLTMDGTIWAVKGAAKGVEVGGFEPLEDYVEQFLGLGGKILVCAPCSEYYCTFDREQIPGTFIHDCELVGLATVVAQTGNGTRVISF
jgi:predicted peroxiredoxin